jgi:hypothetical protein
MPKPIEKAAKHLAEFEKAKSLDELQDAVEATEAVELPEPPAAAERLQARQETARMWLTVIAAIETNLDPKFDPKDVPSVSVIPPPSGGVQFPGGIDPKAIPDPAARAEYEAALKKNRDKADRYRFQTRLLRLDARATAGVERFSKSCYTSSLPDQKEVGEILSQAKLSEPRKRALAALFSGRTGPQSAPEGPGSGLES